MLIPGDAFSRVRIAGGVTGDVAHDALVPLATTVDRPANLSREQTRLLLQTLTEIFPTLEGLRGVAVELGFPDTPISVTAESDPVADTGFALIEWAVAERRAADLIRFLRIRAPLHPDLLRLAPSLLAESPEETLEAIQEAAGLAGTTRDLEEYRDQVLPILRPALRRAERSDLESLLLKYAATLAQEKEHPDRLAWWLELRNQLRGRPDVQPDDPRLVEAERRVREEPWPISSLEVKELRNLDEVRLLFRRGVTLEQPLLPATGTVAVLGDTATASLDPGKGSTPGQWLFFVGENGVGKSSLLRAFCLALCQDAVANALLGIVAADAPTIRRGASFTSIVLGGAWDVPARAIRREGALERVEDRDPYTPPFLAAYGARRGSAARGESTGLSEVLNHPARAVQTLFDEDAPLVSAKAWLQEELAAAVSPGAGPERRAFFDALLQTLARLLPGVERLEVVPLEGIFISGPGVGERTPLSGLSDGYLTTLGWTVDLVARWAAEARRCGLRLDAGFTSRMAGVVLVDDIDVHLHPRWQYTLVQDLRSAFPRMTFVVTTHNPLTLLSSREGEVHVVRRRDGRVCVDQIDLPPASNADQILTGAWFGLGLTMDPDTAELIRRYQEAVLQDRASQEAATLREQLEVRLDRWPRSSLAWLLGPPTSPEASTPADVSALDDAGERTRRWLALRRQAKGSGGGGA